MSGTSDINARAGELRQKALSIVTKLSEKIKEFELPEPGDWLAASRDRLAQNIYKVLVVGEAKRGKSTFVNALMGKDILPTDVDIATSQVFYIRQAEEEAYRLRFEDDSLQEIKLEDLPKYGSQVIADTDGAPQLDQIIRWIEVEGKFTFIPSGVSILDTPGLGALYQAHAQITQRFVPQCDAVIFALDSGQPMGQPELEFIQQILEATTHIFFIQTKIDLQRRESWEAVQHRNVDILQERFGHKLPDTRVWPIASTLLRKAAITGDDAYVIVSRHKELAAALQAFLFHVAGWTRTADVLASTDQYYGTAQKILIDRLAALQEETVQKRDEVKQATQKRALEFSSDWGPNGEKRRTLLTDVQRASALGKAGFRQSLQPLGTIEQKLRDQVAETKTVADVKALDLRITSLVAFESSEEWRRVAEKSQKRIAELLQPFLESAEEIQGVAAVATGSFNISGQSTVTVTDDWWTRIMGARNYAGTVLMLQGTAVGIASVAGMAAFLPLILGGGLIVGAVAGVAGWKAMGTTQLERGQAQLNQRIAMIMQQVRSHFFDVNDEIGQFSVVDEFFTSLEKAVTERVQAIVKQKSEQVNAEIDRLSESAHMMGEERQIRIEAAARHVQAWEALGQPLKEAVAELAAMERRLAPPSASAAVPPVASAPAIGK